MATPIKFEHANTTFTAPDNMPDCLPLPAYINPYAGQIISCWKLSPEELEIIKQTGVFYLGIHGDTQPPVWISSVSPFIDRVDPDDKQRAIQEKMTEIKRIIYQFERMHGVKPNLIRLNSLDMVLLDAVSGQKFEGIEVVLGDVENPTVLYSPKINRKA